MGSTDTFAQEGLTTPQLADRVRWYITIRWFILAAIAAPNLLVQSLLRSTTTPIEHNLFAASFVALYNLILLVLVRYIQRKPTYYWLVRLQLAIDLSAISYLVYTNGGIESHTVLLYTIPILITGIFFTRLAMFITAGASMVLFSTIAYLEHTGIILSPSPVNPLLAHNTNGFLAILLFINTALLVVALVGNYFVDLWHRSMRELQTARHATTEAFKEQAKDTTGFQVRTEALLNSIGEGLIVVNEYGNITDVNKIALDMLGYKQEELIGEWFPKALPAVDDEKKPINLQQRPMVRALETGRAVRARMRYVTKSGSTLSLAMTAAPFILEGKPVGGVLVFRDITKELQIENMKTEFISLASHQLRTPATAVKQLLGLIREGYARNKTEAKDYLEQAYKSNEEQLNIIDDILNVAKIEAGRIQLKHEPTHIAEIITSLIDQLRDQAKAKKITIHFDQPKQPVTITADSIKIKMVIGNLISNAIKYTHDGGHVVIKVVPERKFIKVVVEDNGIGINEADQKKLFAKFSRIANDYTIQVQGTGLGLYLVKQIVRLHGGTIGLESKEGKGSRFTIKLPKGA